MKKGNLLMMMAATAMAVSSVSVSAVDLQVGGSVLVRDQYEFNSANAGNNAQRNRVRLSAQYGAKAVISDNVETGIGITTLGSSRSLNTTFGSISGNSSSTALAQPAVAIDYAYIKHTRGDMSATLGRFKSPFYMASSLIWDNDQRYEGVGANYNWGSDTQLTGVWSVLDESASSLLDATLYEVQIIHANKFMDMPIKGGLAFIATTYAANNGTVLDSDQLTSELSAFNLGAELGVNLGISETSKVYGEAVLNNGASSDKYGFLLGVSAGSKKLSAMGTWAADLNYRYLQKNAFAPGMVDDNVTAAGKYTNIKGWCGSVKYAVDKDLVAGVAYRIISDIANYETSYHSIQLDLSTKF